MRLVLVSICCFFWSYGLLAQEQDELQSLSIKELMNIPLDRDNHRDVDRISQPDNNKISEVTEHFGIIAPISMFPVYSAEIIAAADLATQYVNENGGVNGRRLVVLRADDVENTDVSAQLAEKLVDDYRTSAIIGPATSNSVEDVLRKVTIPKRIPLITQAASAVELTKISDKQMFWRMVANNDRQVELIHEFLTKTKRHKKIFMIAGRDLYSEELLARLQSRMTSSEDTWLKHMSLSHLVYLDGMNLKEEIERIQSLGATAIVITLPTAQMNAILRKVQLHWKGELPMILAADTVKPKYIRDANLGKITQCIFTYVASPTALDPALSEPIKALLNRDSAGFDAAYVYDAIILLAMSKTIEEEYKIPFKQAMNSLASNGFPITYRDFAKIKTLYKKHKSFSYSGFSGRIQFDSLGENVAAKMTLYPIADDKENRLSCSLPQGN